MGEYDNFFFSSDRQGVWEGLYRAATLLCMEVHGPKSEVEPLRAPMKRRDRPVHFWPHVLPSGFSVPKMFATLVEDGDRHAIIQSSDFVAQVYWKIKSVDSSDNFRKIAADVFAKISSSEEGLGAMFY